MNAASASQARWESLLSDLRLRIGRTLGVAGWLSEVTADAVRHFALANGSVDARWYLAVRGDEAPPAILYAFANGDPGPHGGTVGGVGSLPEAYHAMIGGDAWHWHQPVLIGDRITAQRAVTDVSDRSRPGRPRTAVVTESVDFTEARRGHLATQVHTSVVRESTPLDSRIAAPLVGGVEPAGAAPPNPAAHVATPAGPTEPATAPLAVGTLLGPAVRGPLTLSHLVFWIAGAGSHFAWLDEMAELQLRRHPGSFIRHPQTGEPVTRESMHWDDDVAHGLGLPAGFDFGHQRISWIAQSVPRWFPGAASLHALDVRLRAPVHLGDTITLTGTVTAVETAPREETLVICDLDVVNQHGARSATGRASIAVRTPRHRPGGGTP